MNDNFKMCGLIGSKIKNGYFVFAKCFENQPKWRQFCNLKPYDILDFCCSDSGVRSQTHPPPPRQELVKFSIIGKQIYVYKVGLFLKKTSN